MQKPALFSRCGWRACAVILAAIFLLAAVTACSGGDGAQATPTPAATAAPTPSPTPSPTPAPTEAPTPTATPESTPKPTPVVSFPPLETDSSGAYVFPQVIADKESAMTEEPVYFKIVTSEKVNKIQTVIDGDTGKIYTDYDKEGSFRIWRATIHFTVGGTRKVQFKCTTDTGGTVLIPKSPVKIDVTFDYTAESTSKTISKGKTVAFSLRTPDSIDNIYALVDGVNQNMKYDKPAKSEGGVNVWNINITFFGLGDRTVTFEARKGTKVIATFPDPGITIIVKENI